MLRKRKFVAHLLKVVSDSNILLTSFIVKIGISNRIVRQSAAAFRLCTREAILRETERIIQTERIGRKYRYIEDELVQFLTGFRTPPVAQKVTDLPTITVVKDDSSDNIIVACAEKADAQMIITGDQHLLQLKMFNQIRIVTPREFLSFLNSPA